MIDRHVTSLELSKRLAELGVKQESFFYYVRNNDGDEFDIVSKEFILYLDDEYFKDGGCVCCQNSYEANEIYSSFLASELGEMLPVYINDCEFDFYRRLRNGQITYFIDCISLHKTPHIQADISEANCRAKMLIYLIENGLVKAEDL